MQNHPQSRKALPHANLDWWPKHHTLNSGAHRRARATITETGRLSEVVGTNLILASTV